jgi:6-phosphofructokinase 2
MIKIVTITLNPSIDKSVIVQSLIPDQKLKCRDIRYEPGGGGINVSRALQNLGGNSEAWFLAGGHFGNFFIDMINRKNLLYEAFIVKNETRESLILFDESNDSQYLLGMEGPEIEENEWQGFLKRVNNLGTVDIMVASGSLPPGIPSDYFGRLAKIAKAKGAKFIIDTSGEALKIAIDEGVYLCKPNLRELGLLVGLPGIDIFKAKEVATEILHKQHCEAIVVSLGADGALLVSKDFIEHIPAPPAQKKSTVGAGDSMVAGIVLSLSKNKTLQKAVRYGVACGAAATMNPGTSLCKKEDADALYAWIEKKMESSPHN